MPELTAEPVPRFSIGERVQWTSPGGFGARGNREFARTGEVMAVVEPGQSPEDAWPGVLDHKRYDRQFNLYSRKEASYLVLVRPPTGRAKPKLYWPRAGQLSKVDDQE